MNNQNYMCVICMPVHPSNMQIIDEKRKTLLLTQNLKISKCNIYICKQVQPEEPGNHKACKKNNTKKPSIFHIIGLGVSHKKKLLTLENRKCEYQPLKDIMHQHTLIKKIAIVQRLKY